MTKEHIQEIFDPFGKIVKVVHNIDRRTNLPMNTCYITFSEKADADKAIEYMNTCQMDGLEIKVEYTLRNIPRTRSPRRISARDNGRGKWRRSPSPLRNHGGQMPPREFSPPVHKRPRSNRSRSPL
jgi:RNA recognition motif-containing protein